MPYRYWGRMSTPDGQAIVYISRGEEPQAVKVGERLDEGWLVEAINSDGIRLNYPATGQRAVISVAPPPRDSTTR